MITEQQNSDVELLQLDRQAVLSVRGTVAIERLGEAMGERVGALSDYVRQHGVEPTGPFFVRYHTFGEVETDMETGIPVTSTSEVVSSDGAVTPGELPGGPAATTLHLGPHQNLGEAYARVSNWIEEHGREADGPAWEIYHWIDLSHPDLHVDPSTSGTQLVQPVK